MCVCGRGRAHRGNRLEDVGSGEHQYKGAVMLHALFLNFNTRFLKEKGR